MGLFALGPVICPVVCWGEGGRGGDSYTQEPLLWLLLHNETTTRLRGWGRVKHSLVFFSIST